MTIRIAVAITLVQLTVSSCEGDQVPGDVRDDQASPQSLSGDIKSSDGASSPEVRSPEWGPLAVVKSTGGGDDALIMGAVRITDACAFLEDGGKRTLIVWPDSRTSWLSPRNAIEFVSGSGVQVVIEHQDPVTFSGGGSSKSEGGIARGEFLESTDWVARPPSECVVGSRWFIADVVESP